MRGRGGDGVVAVNKEWGTRGLSGGIAMYEFWPQRRNRNSSEIYSSLLILALNPKSLSSYLLN